MLLATRDETWEMYCNTWNNPRVNANDKPEAMYYYYITLEATA